MAYPPDSGPEPPAALPASVRSVSLIDGGLGSPWGRLSGLAEYDLHEDLTPDASDFLKVHGNLRSLGVGLEIYQRKLGGITVHQAFVVCPGRPGSCSRLRAGDLLRAVSNRPEGVLMGHAYPAAAPGAVACFVRGGHAPGWLQVSGDSPFGLTPTHGVPWMPVRADSDAAKAPRVASVPLPLGALAVTSVSPPGCLPRLLYHLRAARTGDGSNDAPFFVPMEAGLPSSSGTFPVCMAHLLARGVVLGWGGPDVAFQLRVPEGGGRRRRARGHRRRRPPCRRSARVDPERRHLARRPCART